MGELRGRWYDKMMAVRHLRDKYEREKTDAAWGEYKTMVVVRDAAWEEYEAALEAEPQSSGVVAAQEP
jgi:hypothetical protein